MPTLSKPLLPVNFITEVESHPMMSGCESAIHGQEAHAIRLEMRNWTNPLSPDHFVTEPDPISGFTREAERTPLHLAARDGDVLQVCEYLRCGANPDKADRAGITPLYFVIETLASLETTFAVFKMSGMLLNARECENERSRLAWVARILIEQHVDVNRALNGVSIMQVACRSVSPCWDIILLLLKHGAKSSNGTVSSIRSPTHRSRFSALVSSTGSKAGQSRPPRVCPCWSGKTLFDCHGGETQLYPLEFVCVCGSGKTYKRCCHSRQARVIESWNKETQRIQHDYDLVSRASPSFRNQLGDAMNFMKEVDAMHRSLGLPVVDLNIPNPNVLAAAALFKKSIEKDLASKGLIDPAFAHALTRFDLFPRPHRRAMSRNLAENTQMRWNALIDEYILLGIDPRSKKDIERAAKIGTWNGALIRTCEGKRCGNYEDRDVECFKFCSKCKMSVYCSPSCQRSDWPIHKTICGSIGQQEQALPSQLAIQKITDSSYSKLFHELDELKEMFRAVSTGG